MGLIERVKGLMEPSQSGAEAGAVDEPRAESAGTTAEATWLDVRIERPASEAVTHVDCA